MKPLAVTRARLLEVTLPLRTPFALSGGVMTQRRSLVVELTDRDGHSGFGESAPFELPFYSGEILVATRRLLTDVLLPRLLESPVETSAEVRRLLSAGIRGNHFARAGAEGAWWDLRARSMDVSLADLVERRLRELGVPEQLARPDGVAVCGVALGIPEGESASGLAAEVRESLEAGFRRIKLKVRPGWSVEPVGIALREMQMIGRPVPLWVDGNGSFDPVGDREELDRLIRDDVMFVEQPFRAESWWDAREWERSSGGRMCLDESLVSDDVARQIVAMGGPSVWNLKLQRLGGIEETCRVYARGVREGARMWVGTMPETGLGAHTALIFASLGAIAYPTDVEPSDRWYEPGTDIVPLEMTADGTMRWDAGVRPRLTDAREVWSS